MTDVKTMSTRKTLLAKIGQILIHSQLFNQKTISVEATNHDSAPAETMSSISNRYAAFTIITGRGQKSYEQGNLIGLGVIR